MTDITVIGLGQMGHEVARLLIEAGRSVTIWNRSREKGASLEAKGAVFAGSAAEAFAASPIIITLLLNADALRSVLHSDDVAAALKGRTIIDMGTAGPDDAIEKQDWLRSCGAELIDAAIQAAPSQMGQPDTPILVSGPKQSFEAVRPSLEVLGGGLIYLGEDIAGTAFMDLATLSYVYGSYAGFLHGARIAEQIGLDVGYYGKIVNAISPSFGSFFEHEGKVIQSGDFAITESPMRISIDAVARLVRVSANLGIDASVPALLDDWLKEAEASGYADEEVAALIKVLRRRSEAGVQPAA